MFRKITSKFKLYNAKNSTSLLPSHHIDSLGSTERGIDRCSVYEKFNETLFKSDYRLLTAIEPRHENLWHMKTSHLKQNLLKKCKTRVK